MNKRTRPLIVFGTCPEAIKLASIVQAALRRTDYFGIEADCNLDLMIPGQSLAQVTARCVEAVDEVILKNQPD